MRVAFYAPLKAPDAMTPSGDRLIARLLIETLRRAGHEIDVASRFRSLDLTGDLVRQARLARIGDGLARRLIRRLCATAPAARPALWLTYHVYHRAPDWLGPRVAAALAIPYVIAEASLAPKQERGPWAAGLAAARDAVGAARLIVGLNPADEACVRPHMRASARYLWLAPYIDGAPFRAARARHRELRAVLAHRHGLDASVPWLLAVGMMRPGNKLACYELLARALCHLADEPWQLVIVGDGPARAAVEHCLAPLGARATLLGELAGEALAQAYGAADLFVWPAVREPIGMVFLEAQAAGLAVIGADRPGVRGLVRPGVTAKLVPEGNAEAIAGAVRALLANPYLRHAMGEAAAHHAKTNHDLTASGARLAQALEELVA